MEVKFIEKQQKQVCLKMNTLSIVLKKEKKKHKPKVLVLLRFYSSTMAVASKQFHTAHIL